MLKCFPYIILATTTAAATIATTTLCYFVFVFHRVNYRKLWYGAYYCTTGNPFPSLLFNHPEGNTIKQYLGRLFNFGSRHIKGTKEKNGLFPGNHLPLLRSTYILTPVHTFILTFTQTQAHV